MVAPLLMSQAEITSTKVTIEESGQVAVVNCFVSDGSPLSLTMSRFVLERLCTQADHELKRVPKPARGHSVGAA
jgi:hypothetical protein